MIGWIQPADTVFRLVLAAYLSGGEPFSYWDGSRWHMGIVLDERGW